MILVADDAEAGAAEPGPAAANLKTMAEVPHDFRDVVVLVDIGDFTYADAAQILDIPIGTVMSRLHRGRRILKKTMADQAVEGEVA